MPEDPELRAGDAPLPGGDFRLFVQKLGYQALIGMGVLDNPLTGTRSRNLEQARGVVDDLLMLREKTEGNLSSEEEAHVEDVIATLRRHLLALSERE